MHQISREADEDKRKEKDRGGQEKIMEKSKNRERKGEIDRQIESERDKGKDRT
jgi:hypothetical protein